MPRKVTKKEKGIFEKEPGSDIWWVRYYIDAGSVGRKLAAEGTRSSSTNSARRMPYAA